MPSINPPENVLVTGASGFIAVWVCKALLEAGYSVRGTVRSVEKGDYLAHLFKTYGDKFNFVVVEDMTLDGAFGAAVLEMDAVIHTASPCTFEAEDPNDLIEPSVKGTTSVLVSINKLAPRVRRVVYTSSASTIIDPSKPPGTIFTEDDWNNYSIDQVNKKGKNAGNDMYRASKVLAEKAAWAECGKQQKWDLVTIHPVVTLGPILHDVSSPAQLNTSVKMFYNIINTKEGEVDSERLTAPNNNFGDVRDVALTHVRALGYSEAGGQRFIAAQGPHTWQDALDVLPLSYPRGTLGSGKGVEHIIFDSTKASRVLHVEFRSFEDTVKDTEKDLRKRGWLQNN